jgi:hypothetical protein
MRRAVSACISPEVYFAGQGGKTETREDHPDFLDPITVGLKDTRLQ